MLMLSGLCLLSGSAIQEISHSVVILCGEVPEEMRLQQGADKMLLHSGTPHEESLSSFHPITGYIYLLHFI